MNTHLPRGRKQGRPPPVFRRWMIFPLMLVIAATAAHGQVPASIHNLPFDPPAYRELNNSARKVYAHYITQFPVSLDNEAPAGDYYARNYLNPRGEDGKFLGQGGFLRQRPLPRPPRPGDWALADMRGEVRQAKSIGVDGFAVDLLNYEGSHWERIRRLLEAARLEGGGFQIMLMPDMNAALRREPGRLVDMITALAGHPAAMRLDDGRLVLAPYMAHLQTPAWWAAQLGELARRGIRVALVPVFHDWRRYYRGYADFSHGVSDWGGRRASAAGRWRDMAQSAHAAGLLWMAPVAPQDVRPKDGTYWESRNSEMFRRQWQAAIEGGADWVHLITWNDYSEHSTIAPGTATRYAFHDLSAYYIAWFKAGRRPRITRDAIYAIHRTHSTGTRPHLQAAPMRPAGSSDAPRNQVEMLAFLTAPATLEISLAGSNHRVAAGAGITSFRIPLEPGVPRFRVVRDGETVSTLTGVAINEDIQVQDLLYHGRSSLRQGGGDIEEFPTPPAAAAPAISTLE